MIVMEMMNVLFATWLTLTTAIAGGNLGAGQTAQITTAPAPDVTTQVACEAQLYSPDEAIIYASWDAFAD
jgi:hypothetical protein